MTRTLESDRDVVARFKATVLSTASPGKIWAVLGDLRTHLDWTGENSASQTFRLLDLDAPDGPVTEGTVFTSTGASDNGTFHDRSRVTAAVPDRLLAFETDSKLDRPKADDWVVRFTNRYEIEPTATGSSITYRGAVHRGNYQPWWLWPVMRRVSQVWVNRMTAKQLANLARLAEQPPTGS